MIIHVPHASTLIPVREEGTFLVPATRLQDEIRILTDWYVDELFAVPDAEQIVYPVSRIVADPERFEDDEVEQAAKLGFGAVYTQTTKFELLRKLTVDQRNELMARYYRPHHRKLTEAVERELKEKGRALIIDAHSFPDQGLPFESSAGPRPDICIGTDDFHTPSWLREYLVNGFREKGYTVAVNEPFAGTIVPVCYYREEPEVYSVMVEVNKRLYLKGDTGVKSPAFPKVAEDIRSILNPTIGA